MTPDRYGQRVDLYFRRIIAEFFLTEQGFSCAKGFTVEVIDGNLGNLRRENLRLVFNKNLAIKGEQQRRNSWVTHDVIRLRSKALESNLSPDAAMAFIAASKTDAKLQEPRAGLWGQGEAQ